MDSVTHAAFDDGNGQQQLTKAIDESNGRRQLTTAIAEGN